MAKNVLKAWLVDNTVTTDDKTDKIFSLETTRSIGKDIILDRIGGKEPRCTPGNHGIGHRIDGRSDIRGTDEW